MQFTSQYETDYGKVPAFIGLAMIPALIFYLFAEQQPQIIGVASTWDPAW